MSCNQQNDIWSLYNSFDSEENNTKNDNSEKHNLNIDENDQEKCNYCNIYSDFKIEDGYKWCSECGENNGIFIDVSPEWRYYGSEDSKSSDPTRCGMPVNNLLYNMSCGTMISSRGNSLEVKKLRTIHKYITSNYNDRAILSIFENLNIVGLNNNINSLIIEDAKKIYKDIRDIKICRGINRDALVATCLMTSLNINNVSRSQKEIAEIFNINQTHITQARKKLLELNNYIKNDLIYSINITTPENFIPRFCSSLNIEEKYVVLMKLIAKKVQKLPDISENTPPSIASGIIYLICYLCKLNITKKNISDICKISEVTINKCFKKLIIFVDLLFSESLKKKYNINYTIKIK
jgi:transcription initiation factor TFIIB